MTKKISQMSNEELRNAISLRKEKVEADLKWLHKDKRYKALSNERWRRK